MKILSITLLLVLLHLSEATPEHSKRGRHSLKRRLKKKRGCDEDLEEALKDLKDSMQTIKENSENRLSSIEEQLKELSGQKDKALTERVASLENQVEAVKKQSQKAVESVKQVSQELKGLASRNLMNKASLQDVYNQHGGVSEHKGSWKLQGALYPTDDINNPFSFTQQDVAGGWNCIGATEDKFIQVVFDMQAKQDFVSVCLFSYDQYMNKFEVLSYPGEKNSPTPKDSGWESQGITEEFKDKEGYSAKYQQAHILTMDKFSSRYLMVRVWSNYKYKVIAGIKAFSRSVS